MPGPTAKHLLNLSPPPWYPLDHIDLLFLTSFPYSLLCPRPQIQQAFSGNKRPVQPGKQVVFWKADLYFTLFSSEYKFTVSSIALQQNNFYSLTLCFSPVNHRDLCPLKLATPLLALSLYPRPPCTPWPPMGHSDEGTKQLNCRFLFIPLFLQFEGHSLIPSSLSHILLWTFLTFYPILGELSWSWYNTYSCIPPCT